MFIFWGCACQVPIGHHWLKDCQYNLHRNDPQVLYQFVGHDCRFQNLSLAASSITMYFIIYHGKSHKNIIFFEHHS